MCAVMSVSDGGAVVGVVGFGGTNEMELFYHVCVKVKKWQQEPSVRGVFT